MKILQIIFLVLIVSHKVLTNRLVENTTCLELAKPSNQQLRLTCSQYDYHCLLDDTFTKEFEVCREWKWIPGGKCAYFNTYGNGNVDERDCKPGINLTCSESNHQFESYKNTQYTACYKKKTIVTSISTTTRTLIQATSNWTTNGGVKKASTFEIRTVLPIVFGIIVPFLSVSLICSICMRLKATKKGQKRDEEKLPMPTAGSDHVESENGEERDDGSTDEFHDVNEVLSTSRKSSIEGKSDENSELHPLLGNHLEDNLKNPLTIRREDEDNTPEEQKEDEDKSPKNTAASDNLKSDVEEDKTQDSTDELIEVDENFPKGQKRDEEKLPMPTAGSDLEISENGEERDEDSTDEFYDVNEVLSTDNTPEEQKGDKEKTTENPACSDNLKSDVEEEKTKQSTDELIEGDENFPKGTEDSKHLDIVENCENAVSPQPYTLNEDFKLFPVSDPIISDREEENEDNKTEKIHQASENSPAGKSDNEKENEEESTDVFNDTIGSLQRIAPIADEKGREECTNIHNLLEKDGLKLAQKVMTTIITRETGNSVESLLNNKIYKEKSKLKEELPEHRTLFCVSYRLHQTFLDEKHNPKSGWGNPVRGKDIGIGDDVERLYRVYTICCGISKPENLPVESYFRLLDIMLKALTRLDNNHEFEKDLTGFAKEITCFKETISCKNTDKN